MATLWTLLLIASVALNMIQQDREVLRIARFQASAFIEKDLALRLWASSHGGVYVRPSAETPPNPYLDVPDRDVVTTEGIQLTLMNPAYITREIFSQFTVKFGIYGHMTSLQLKNPTNAPDDWERAVLQGFAAGDLADATQVYVREGKPYLRLMKPMLMEESCLPCHAWTGIPVGGVRGGINTSVPLEPLRQSEGKLILYIALSHGLLWLIGVASILGVSKRVARVRVAHDLSEARNRELYEQATHDALTGLFNRRYLEEALLREMHRARRQGSPLCLAMIDVDHFKRFNDEHGHDAGDEVLRQIGNAMQASLRKSDIACRFGGEELVMVMPDATLRDILPRMVALRARVAALRLRNQDGEILPSVTVSMGVAEFAGECAEPAHLLKRADQALYAAKAAGRNRIEVGVLEEFTQPA